MTNYYVYPDGTITEEPLEFMSDDYFIIQAEGYEDAYEMALMLGLIQNQLVIQNNLCYNKVMFNKEERYILFTIPTYIMQDEELSPSAKLVFSVISSYVGTEEKNISYETISKKTSLTPMTIIRAVRALEDNGFLEVTKSTRGWNLYRVISEEENMLIDQLQYSYGLE